MLHPGFVFPKERTRFQGLQGCVQNPLQGFGLRLQMIILPFAMAMRLDQPCAAQVRKMTGDPWLIDVERAMEETDANLAFAHQVQEAKAIHIRQGGKEERGWIIHGIHIRVDGFVFK